MMEAFQIEKSLFETRTRRTFEDLERLVMGLENTIQSLKDDLAEREVETARLAAVEENRGMKKLNDKLAEEKQALQGLVDELLQTNLSLRKTNETTKENAIKNQDDLIAKLKAEREKVKYWSRLAKLGSRPEGFLPTATAISKSSVELPPLDKTDPAVSTEHPKQMDEPLVMGAGDRSLHHYSPSLPPIPKMKDATRLEDPLPADLSDSTFSPSVAKPDADVVKCNQQQDARSDSPEFLRARSLKRRNPGPRQLSIDNRANDRVHVKKHPDASNGSRAAPFEIKSEPDSPVPRGMPLQPIDGNAQSTPAGKTKLTAGAKRKSDEHRPGSDIAAFARDGESFGDRPSKVSRIKIPEVHRESHDLLNQILSKSTVKHTPRLGNLVSQSDVVTTEGFLHSKRTLYTDELAKSRVANQDTLARDWDRWDKANALRGLSQPLSYFHPKEIDRRNAEAATSTMSTPAATDPKVHPEGIRSARSSSSPRFIAFSRRPQSKNRTPFRSLPLSALNSSHFKLNPAANQNLSHAYHDVVRGSARAHLPGCTRPECCGPQFAALASTLPSSPTGDTTGPDRAQSLANKYGKAHRAVHARPKTPPGFWDVDFPTSQEREEQLKAAQASEKEETERRWKIAMADDGAGGNRGSKERLWIFADE